MFHPFVRFYLKKVNEYQSKKTVVICLLPVKFYTKPILVKQSFFYTFHGLCGFFSTIQGKQRKERGRFL
jgi:hypothetical protein